MRIVIAGLGSIGRRHLRNLVALGEHDVLLLRSHQSTLPDDELAAYPETTDLAEALSWCPDGVVVANPTSMHLDVAVPAAAQGSAVLVEKPLSHSLAGVEGLEAAVGPGGGRVLVGFQFRFHPGLRRIVDLLAQGDIGEPLTVRAHWGEYLPGWHPWEEYRRSYAARRDLGGGVLLTLSHPLDYLRWLIGDVQSVSALLGHTRTLGIEVDDVAELALRFESGVVGSVHLNYHQQPASHHLIIVGSKGSITWDNSDGVVRLHRGGSGGGTVPTVFEPPAGFERNSMFLEQMRHFLAVARGEIDPTCTLRDGIEALRLAVSAAESAQTQQTVDLNPARQRP